MAMNPYAKAILEVWSDAVKAEVDKWLNGSQEAVMQVCTCVEKRLPMRCRACGGYFQLEEPLSFLQPGDVVEWAAGGSRLAVVQAVTEDRSAAVVILDGTRKGDTEFYPIAALRVVHGFIRVNRSDTDSCDHNY